MENAEKALPTVRIFINGQERNLKCSFFVLCEYQRQTGKNPFGLQIDQMSPEDMVVFLYAAMKQDDDTITKEQVEKWMGGHHMSAIGQLIAKVFEQGVPAADKESDQTNPDQPKKK